jgi:hypothetical protein
VLPSQIQQLKSQRSSSVSHVLPAARHRPAIGVRKINKNDWMHNGPQRRGVATVKHAAPRQSASSTMTVSLAAFVVMFVLLM